MALWILTVAYFGFAAIVLTLRYWVLPDVGSYVAEIEQSVSKTLGERVTIGAIDAGWHGLRPELLLANVTLHDHEGHPALTLPEVGATLAWSSLLRGEPHFYSLAFEGPKLEIRRDKAGKFYIAGVELHAEQKGQGGIAAWLLSQREIAIHGASVTWDDELRGAPRLSLDALDFVLRNSGESHRFAFKAKPPAELASALDLRGELRGGDIADVAAWSGRFFAELEYTNLVAWRPWVDYPLDIRSGSGGLRLWLSFNGLTPVEAVADVALARVNLRVGKDLPLLNLAFLQGRIGARQKGAGSYEVFGRKIALKTGTGVALPAADFSLRQMAADGRNPATGELEANGIELAPLANLAEYLPFPRRVRARLAAAEPRGGVRDLRIDWSGDAENPLHYRARARFAALGVRAHEGIPGFAGLSGRVEADENSGRFVLSSEKTDFELPGILADGRAHFDALSGEVGWKRTPDRVELRFDNLTVAGQEITGALSGSYAALAEGPGTIDLTGNFSRIEAKTVYRYVPFLPAGAVEYLKASILGGYSNDMKLRLKGDLRHFPFADAKQGTFRVKAKLSEMVYRYAEGWPRIFNGEGELALDGAGIRVEASSIESLDLKANRVLAAIPDIYRGDEQLHLEIGAEDGTGDFLGFLAKLPPGESLAGILGEIHAEGSGRLRAKFDIPIRRAAQTKVAGDYEFRGNQIRIDGDMPPFSQVNGHIEFTESKVTARPITAQFLGGPAAMTIRTRADGVIVAEAQGTANLSSLPPFGMEAIRRISGRTAWHALLSGGRGKPFGIAIDSQLAGALIDLPAPLGKTAAQSLPLRVEWTMDGNGEPEVKMDTITASLGNSVNLLVRRRQGNDGKWAIDRGVVSFNESPALPANPGMVFTGNLPYVDFDRWRELLSGNDSGAGLPLSLDLKVSALDFSGKRLNDLGVRARREGADWIADIAARELAGEVRWQPEGAGRLSARLRQLTVPESAPGAAENSTATRNVPSLDIAADEFILHGRDLGKLQLMAVSDGGDLRIEKLTLASKEGTLNADGMWRNWNTNPAVSANVKVDVGDIGKYLDRFGYPSVMQGGAAKLEGTLNWSGNPYAIDYPTLGGKLKLDANKGQFLKAEPGVARLLGVLSMQSWVTLDFRELFGHGFVFDNIAGTAAIDRGVMKTADFQMRGPSARVTMSGDIDLVKETQNLRAHVVPAIGASLSSIIAIIGSPLAGLGAAVLQNVLKDPLGQIFAFDYAVTGTWAEPKTERIKIEARPAETTTGTP